MPDPLWYKDAIIYELHVRAFADSSGDGMGDFRGLVARLDYVQDLGVDTLWLLPFYPSPWRDDGYDVSDYTDVHPAYGTLRDVRRFLDEAHRRGLRVITELVLNHTSDRHPWFQRARRAKPGSTARDFYVWSDSPDRYREARIIFSDFETSNWSWDPVARAYYWHRFYSHQPDLNFDNPAVHDAMLRVMDFWLDLGIDGMRLDAIPYLYEREGTSCDNLPETHAFLKKLRAHLDERFSGRVLLAEANLWPEEAVAYFGDGDECHMAFHFPVMPRLFMSIRLEDRFPLIDILRQTPAIPATCQWAIFLRNHDELTLETVTDEERDYMYRMYAEDPQARHNLGIRRRLAPLLGNDRRIIELMNGLLFSLPGTPVIYYGDEIGMGDNIYLGDRNGVRTPMQWSADRNAGFSRANPQRLYLPVITDPQYHYASVNVEQQEAVPSSLLWWMRRIIGLRRRHRAFGRGDLTFLYPDNRKVLAFVRAWQDERILVVANLSRHAQHVQLDLSGLYGAVPVEMFGRTPFPAVGAGAYPLTLAPYAFHWFEMRPAAEALRARPGRADALPLLELSCADRPAFADPESAAEVLAGHAARQPWFRGPPQGIRRAGIADILPVAGQPRAGLVLLDVDYAEDESDRYLLPVAWAEASPASGAGVIARARRAGVDGVLLDALADASASDGLLRMAGSRRRSAGLAGEAVGVPTVELREDLAGLEAMPTPSGATGSSVAWGETLLLTVYRRLERDGLDPDLEVGRWLTQRGFASTPAVLGALEYRTHGDPPSALAVVRRYVPNEGNAWSLCVDAVSEAMDRAAALRGDPGPVRLDARGLLAADRVDDPGDVRREVVGAFVEWAAILGRRVATMHAVLATGAADGPFGVEPMTLSAQRSLYQALRNRIGRTLPLLRRSLHALRPKDRPAAERLLEREDALLELRRDVLEPAMDGVRTRVHGGLRLDRVLYTGNDFVISGFGGDPARTLGERRLRRSPLWDVAVLLADLYRAAHVRRLDPDGGAPSRHSDAAGLAPWADLWYQMAAAALLGRWLAEPAAAALVPSDPGRRLALLDALLVEAQIGALAGSLERAPAEAGIPLRALHALLEPPLAT
jgi:maltose alpha-D-glucosyltransferase/alpha-amylase